MTEIQRVAIVEVGGTGGVFQHSFAVANIARAAGMKVTVFTSDEAELDSDDLAVTKTFSWNRNAGPLRPVLIIYSYLFRFAPSVLRFNGIVWVQGSFKPPLTLFLLALLRIRGKRSIYSPHTLFSRHGKRADRFFSNLCLRIADEIVVYNESDFNSISAQRGKIWLCPLVMHVPQLNRVKVNHWMHFVENNKIGVCALGQIRTDKNLPMLIQAASLAGTRLLIAGQDAGDLESVRETAAKHPGSVQIIDQYLELDDFAAVLYSVGLTALPYTVASQSAIAVLAKAYGATVIGRAVGGLTAQIDVTVESLDAASWGSAIRAARTNMPPRLALSELPLVGSEEEIRAIKTVLSGRSTLQSRKSVQE